MKLGILSDCVHFQLPNGEVGTENHIFLRQMQHLSSHFEETIICCPFDKYNDTRNVTTYSLANIRFERLPNVGGNSWKEKLKLLIAIPSWWHGYRIINKSSDVVYQRFPNNLNIPGSIFFWAKRKCVFGTYTGTWNGYESEPITYKLQRWIIKHIFLGPVWVYSPTTDAKNILPGFSPSYSTDEWAEEQKQVESRIRSIKKYGVPTVRMISVGTLIDYKNQSAILRACRKLKDHRIRFLATFVGDGPMRSELSRILWDLDLQSEVQFIGKKNHAELRKLYREHDFVVQAPFKEGFGKVPIEGMFHGAIPVINNISMAGHITGGGTRGFLFDAAKPDDLANTLISIQRNKVEQLPRMILNGREFVRSQTLEAWSEEYYSTVKEYFGIT